MKYNLEEAFRVGYWDRSDVSEFNSILKYFSARIGEENLKFEFDREGYKKIAASADRIMIEALQVKVAKELPSSILPTNIQDFVSILAQIVEISQNESYFDLLESQKYTIESEKPDLEEDKNTKEAFALPLFSCLFSCIKRVGHHDR